MSENPENPASNPANNPANQQVNQQGGQTPPPGWWQAWDGKWYPATVKPEAIPRATATPSAGAASQAEPGAAPEPTYGQAPAYPQAPSYPQATYGAPYGQPGSTPLGVGPYGAPMPASTGTNGMSIAALVLGILWIYGIGSILSLIFGYISLGQIKRDPRQKGKGMAIAGVVLGWVGIVGAIIVIAFIVYAAQSGVYDTTYDDYSY